MKIFACFIFSTLLASAQEYPFQNTGLSDDQRIDNLISLMTPEEKIDHLSPFLPGKPMRHATWPRMKITETSA
ncbi:MAG: hypothetical protein V2B15_14405 [Bacteroidota bacterium]